MDTASPARGVPRPRGPEIAFFDIETTVPLRKGESHSLLEFGAIIICPQTLVQVFSYSTLIKPANLDAISWVRRNGISRKSVGSAPTFADIADNVYAILHGRVWAGHNIVRFDCPRIKEAYAEIGRPAPEPMGLIDTLQLLQRFGPRVGDMKMASLATFFGLGRQSHRSLDDVRMNIEIVKSCATVLFLEASLPDVLSTATSIDEPCITRNEIDIVGSSNDYSILMTHLEEMKLDNLNAGTAPSYTAPPINESSSDFSGYLEPEKVLIQHITISTLLFGKTVVFLKDVPLHLCCANLNVCFGANTKYMDNNGRPKLNIVVQVPKKLCKLLNKCDEVAHKMSLEAGSISQWRYLVKKNGWFNLPTIRLHMVIGDHAIYPTKIYQRESSGIIHELKSIEVDVLQLMTLIGPGSMLDAFFDLDVYDYLQYAGIRLVAKKLILHSK